MPLDTLLRRLLDVALLRGGPQDIPYSPALLVVCAMVAAAVSYPAIADFSPGGRPGPQILLLLGFNAAFVYAALSLRGLAARFVQTATALFGTDALITAVALPVFRLSGAPESQTPAAVLAFIGLLLWNLAVVAHIFRHALSIATGAGVLVALGYTFGATLFVQAVLGP